MSTHPEQPKTDIQPIPEHNYDLDALHSVQENNEKFISLVQQPDKYPVTHPSNTFKETVDPHDRTRKKRTCGLSRTQLWAIITITLLVLAGAIGGGVGGSLSAKSKTNSSTTATATTTSASNSPATTTTPTPSTTTTFTPRNKTYAPNTLAASARGDPIATLAGTIRFVLQNDNNFIVYNTSNATAWATLWKSNHTVDGCGDGFTTCTLNFGVDGNLVNYVNGSAWWNAGTAGEGAALVFMNVGPWVMVLGTEGEVVWRAWDGVLDG